MIVPEENHNSLGAPAAAKLLTLLGLGLALVLLALIASSMGMADVGPKTVAMCLAGLAWPDCMPPADIARLVFDLRLPRVWLAVAAGMGLAMSGVAVQGVLMNPLVSPFILGVAPGAAFGAALAMVLGIDLAGFGHYLVVGNAFVTATLAMLLAYGIAHVKRSSRETIILAGIAIGYIFSALVSVLKYISNEDALHNLVFWLMGSLWGASIGSVAFILPLLLVCLTALLYLSWDLNIMSAGDEVATSLGVRVKAVRLAVLLLSTLTTAAVISFTGTIGFVGLVAPHMARMMVGADHRWLFPAATLLGGLLLLGADTLGRVALWPVEVPVGITTALLGGPFFVRLLWRRNRDWWQ
ncbi:hypothetical protein AAU61_17120 [Desulfocarbo indianensis]|nr:hypothetical protein AAU61_17120 [Desulfocarbo indianensis]